MKNLLIAGLWLALSATAVADTLDRIKDRGEIRIGYRQATEPFSFENDQGQATGYSIELCQRIAAAVKDELKLKELKVSYVPVSVKDRFSSVAKGKVDILCAATTITLSRMEQVDFTLMTFTTGGGVLSRSATPINTVSDLTGKTVAVVSDTTGAVALKSYLSDSFIDANVKYVKSSEEARQMVDRGEVDAWADDQIVLIGQLMREGNPRDYTITKDLFSYEPYGLAVARGDADFRLIADRAIARIYRSGQFKALFEKWFARAGIRPSPILQAMYTLQALPD
jgi:ABC-type amino acid transport substrate-binding protein